MQLVTRKELKLFSPHHVPFALRLVRFLLVNRMNKNYCLVVFTAVRSIAQGGKKKLTFKLSRRNIF